LCGKICKQISVKRTPLLLEVPSYHATYKMGSYLCNPYAISHHWCHTFKSGEQVRACVEVSQHTKAKDQANIQDYRKQIFLATIWQIQVRCYSPHEISQDNLWRSIALWILEGESVTKLSDIMERHGPVILVCEDTQGSAEIAVAHFAQY
jgi:hypothetical protein